MSPFTLAYISHSRLNARAIPTHSRTWSPSETVHQRVATASPDVVKCTSETPPQRHTENKDIRRNTGSWRRTTVRLSNNLMTRCIGTSGLRPRHVSRLSRNRLPHLPDIASRGWFARPAMRQAMSPCQAQAKHATNHTQQTKQEYMLPHTVPCYARQQRLLTRHRQASTCAPAPFLGTAPRSPPPRGLACPLRYAHARRHCWAQGRCRHRCLALRRHCRRAVCSLRKIPQ